MDAGEKWHEEQVKKPAEERHVIMRWLQSRYAFLTGCLLAGLPLGTPVTPTGEVREIISLAADVYYLQLVNELPRPLVERLRSYDAFQGARYEIAVAASLVRAGFEIQWRKAQQGAKHYEFDAVHKYTGEIVAIEVKSRRRPGTLHEKGHTPNLSEVKGDIFSLYNQAMEQSPKDKSFGVFIDINVPHQHHLPATAKTWVEDILRKIETKNRAVFGSQVPTFVAITNSAWHYEGQSSAKDGEYLLLLPLDAPFPLKNPVTQEAIYRALNAFSAIPLEAQEPQ